MKTKRTTARNTTAVLLTSAMAGGAAQGAVVYTNFNNLTIFGRDGSASFDLTPDLNSHYSLLYQDSNSQKPEVHGDGVNSFVLARTWQNTNAMDLGNRTYGGLPVTPGGVLVDAQMHDVNPSKQQNGITNLVPQVNGYFSGRPKTTDGDTGGDATVSNIGDWGTGPVSTSGYVGLMLVNNGVTNFGWAHFSWSVDSGSSEDTSAKLTLIDGAYETAPNTGILTGDGIPTAPTFSSVPESLQTYSGGFVTLAALSDGALSYQWQAGAPGSGVYTNLSDSATVSGATSPTLVLKSVMPANTADYVLVASNSFGSTTSTPPATVTVLNPGPVPTTAAGWTDAFQAQTDRTYAGGRANISYKASNGKIYWLFNELAQGTMDPQTHAFNSEVKSADNRILMSSGDALVRPTLTAGPGATIPAGSAAYYFSDMFEANGAAYALLTRMDSVFHFNQMGSELAKFNIASDGLLTFEKLVATPDTDVQAADSIEAMQWTLAAVADKGNVYVFGEYNGGPGTFLARVPSVEIENTAAWTFWNGTSWDVEVTNATPVLSNSVSSVRLYQGAWVALNKFGGINGTNTYAYAAAQPQGPYVEQFLFTNPTNDFAQLGLVANTATGEENYYYSVDPALHPEFTLSSGNLLVGIDYWDASTFSYNLNDAGLFKPRFYEVALTNLPTPIDVTLNIEKVGTNLILSWPVGTLLEAPDLTGPWTTNTATSPYTNTPTGPQKFYRLRVR